MVAATACQGRVHQSITLSEPRPATTSEPHKIHTPNMAARQQCLMGRHGVYRKTSSGSVSTRTALCRRAGSRGASTFSFSSKLRLVGYVQGYEADTTPQAASHSAHVAASLDGRPTLRRKDMETFCAPDNKNPSKNMRISRNRLEVSTDLPSSGIPKTETIAARVASPVLPREQHMNQHGENY